MQSFTRFKLMLKVIIRNSLWPQQTLFVYFLSVTVQCLTNSEQFNIQDASVTVGQVLTGADSESAQRGNWPTDRLTGQEGSLRNPAARRLDCSLTSWRSSLDSSFTTTPRLFSSLNMLIRSSQEKPQTICRSSQGQNQPVKDLSWAAVYRM